MSKTYYIYIATNYSNTVFYTGVTNNIHRRMFEHKNRQLPSFTSKYRINKLIYLQSFSSVIEAISAEKKIKGWVRKRKIALILSQNPNLNDLLDSSLRSE